MKKPQRNTLRFPMAEIKELTGDLLDCGADAIVQQLNCHTVEPKGLAATVKKRYPYADVYGRRRRQMPGKNLACPEDRSTPGTIVIDFPPPNLTGPIVVGVFGQREMGKPGAYTYVKYPEQETAELREQWFTQGMQALADWVNQQPSVKIVAFPKDIGCGLADGDWNHYRRMIQEEFADRLTRSDVTIRIVSLA